MKLTENQVTGEDTVLYLKVNTSKHEYSEPKKCFNCNKVRHFASKCRNKHRSKDVQKKPQEKSYLALSTFKRGSPNK